MPRLFNAYVMVDWSAASKPATGADSIWIGVMKRDARFRFTYEAVNPPTRVEAEKRLVAVLADLKSRSERTLLGFDFPLGFPRGAEARLKTKEAGWAGLWRFLGENVVDKADNTNNRFAVAAKMNRLMTDEPRPFWGAPAKDTQRWLTSTRPAANADDLPALRHAEAATAGIAGKGQSAKSVWQLMGAGSVGGQAIVGLPVARRLLQAHGERMRVWPFQTGWKAPGAADLEGVDVMAAEVYPALIPAPPAAGEVKDQAQVRALCEHFARLDAADRLAPLMAAPKEATAERVAEVEGEEGWILGA